MFVYLDDILICCLSMDEYIVHVRRVLQLLLENDLYVKLEKTLFCAQSPFGGLVVFKDYLSMDPTKIKAVMDWPCLTSLHQILCFLGFTKMLSRHY